MFSGLEVKIDFCSEFLCNSQAEQRVTDLPRGT